MSLCLETDTNQQWLVHVV